MAEVLTEYLESATRSAWSWGEQDCTLWVADFVLLVTGLDPGISFRGKYKTRLGCERLLKRRGGLVALVSDAMAAADIAGTNDPGRGDVGIIPATIRRRRADMIEATAAICLGQGRWAVFSPRGLLVAPTQHTAAWSI